MKLVWFNAYNIDEHLDRGSILENIHKFKENKLLSDKIYRDDSTVFAKPCYITFWRLQSVALKQVLNSS